MKEVLDYLKKTPVFYLATCEGNKPRVRPFGAVTEYGGRLYIITNNKKKVYKQMQENPNIELSATGSDGTWLRVEAKAVQDDNREARVKMLDEYPSLQGIYNPDDKLMEVLYLQDATATFYSFTSQPKTVTF